MKTAICAICGKEFELIPGPRHRKKFCSEECMLEARRGYEVAYRRTHRAERNDRDKAYYQRTKKQRAEPHLHVRICRQCGKEFTTMYAQKVFCGKKCRDKWNVTPPEYRVDLSIPEEARKAIAEARRKANEAVEKKLRDQENARHAEYMRNRVQRTESGAVWYPVSGKEIQRIARETHRSYGEVCAEFLSKQVRGTAGGRTE